MKTNNWFLLFAVIFFDQFSKQIVLSRPEWGAGIIRNSGLPFAPGAAAGVFSLAAVVAGLVLFLIFFRLFLNSAENHFPLALIAGGGLSNILDRLVRGGVIDFLDIGLSGKFNIADVAIWLGIIWLLYNLFVQRGTAEKQN